MWTFNPGTRCETQFCNVQPVRGFLNLEPVKQFKLNCQRVCLHESDSEENCRFVAHSHVASNFLIRWMACSYGGIQPLPPPQVRSAQNFGFLCKFRTYGSRHLLWISLGSGRNRTRCSHVQNKHYTPAPPWRLYIFINQRSEEKWDWMYGAPYILPRFSFQYVIYILNTPYNFIC